MLPDQEQNNDVVVETTATGEVNIETECERLRGCIHDIATTILILKGHSDLNQPVEGFLGQHDEMLANLTLSYRHMEDARMRLGKVMQQIQGGVPVFDRPESPSNNEPVAGHGISRGE